LPRPEDRSDVSAALVERTVDRIRRRMRLAEGLRASAVSAAASALVVAILIAAGFRASIVLPVALPAAMVATAGWLRRRASRLTGSDAAERLERAFPLSRNVIFTAQELLAHPTRAKPSVRSRVIDEAASILRYANNSHVVPLAKQWAGFGAALLALIAAGVFSRPALIMTRQGGPARQSTTPAQPARFNVVATISPPPYTGLPTRTLTNPDRLELIEGSRLRLVLTGVAQNSWRVRYSTTTPLVTATRDGLAVELTVAESGYVAMEPLTSTGDRRLVPVAVTADRSPLIRINRPGKDLLLPDARTSVPLTTTATDDFGLQSLELKYTKVSGTGEQFEFVEGTLPLDVSRDSEREWNANGAFALTRLGLQPGDSLVYRVVAKDRRPGDAGFAASDTYFIEVAGPGQVALAGFELPPDKERYALSQQMIVLKIQRLLARERSVPRETVEQEAGTIGAEQRAVRANFIFLMGGQVEDEEEEAEHSHEIQEGRLENSARREINVAIKYMSHVEQELAAAATGAALPPARAAADALQRAFGRNRYILRTLPVRSRIDPSRRLSGDLAEAADWRRDLHAAAVEPQTREARAILAQLLELTSSANAGGARDSAASVATLAERALAVNPASSEWQEISRRLLEVRDALAAAKRGGEFAGVVQRAAAPLLAIARKSAIAPAEANDATGGLLSAWADEVRRR
jgi:hypothetical protein